MSVGINKKGNQYAAELYCVDAPKTVFMAMVYAFAYRIIDGDPTPEQVVAFVRDEWRILHGNGIVPQKPR